MKNRVVTIVNALLYVVAGPTLVGEGAFTFAIAIESGLSRAFEIECSMVTLPWCEFPDE
jgi:hypothetical protein